MVKPGITTIENSFTTSMEGEEKEEITYEIWVTFAILFTLCGLLGNIFFLVSVTYARIKKSHDFDKANILLFLSNLAIADALSCSFHLANWFVGLLRTYGWKIGHVNVLCKALVLTRKNLGVIDGWSTGAFAFNAAFPRIR